MRDEKGDDEKIVCVPCNDPTWSSITDLDLLSDRLRVEISHFFSIYKEPEGKPVAPSAAGADARTRSPSSSRHGSAFGRRGERPVRSRPWTDMSVRPTRRRVRAE